MTKENQEKQNGRTEGGSGKNANRRNNDRRKNNTSFKRVNLERKRPQLSRGETAAAKEGTPRSPKVAVAARLEGGQGPEREAQDHPARRS